MIHQEQNAPAAETIRKKAKYGAIRTECANGHIHDSKIEAKRCDELHMMQRAGAITALELQPEFRIEINGKLVCKYIADFAWGVGNHRVIEDVKGKPTPVFALKRKLVEAAYPGTFITLYPPKVRKPRKARNAA